MQNRRISILPSWDSARMAVKICKMDKTGSVDFKIKWFFMMTLISLIKSSLAKTWGEFSTSLISTVMVFRVLILISSGYFLLTTILIKASKGFSEMALVFRRFSATENWSSSSL